jgi:hypothetical protein
MLEFRREKPNTSAGTVVIDQYWYLTEDGSRVVPEGDPRSRYLWASPGSEVPRAEAERLGAVKQQPKPADKARTNPGDKASLPADKAGGVDLASLTLEELREHATGLGVVVDRRWGVDRLRQEIAKATQ